MVDPDSVGHELFEKLTAGIALDRDDVVVRHQYDYALNTGGQKEVDVMVWNNSGSSEEQIMIECKDYSGNVSQGVVDEMVGLLCQSDAGRGIVIARTGFQSGAKERARALQETDDMRVELYVLRFVSHNPDDDDPKRLKKVLIDVGYSPNALTPLHTHAVPVDESVTEKLKESDGPMNMNADVRNPLNESGEPIKESLEELLRQKHIEKLDRESEYGAMEVASVPVVVGVNQDSMQGKHVAEFEDVYLESEVGLVKLDRLVYEVSSSWTPVGQSERPITDLSSDFAEKILDSNDMVLIDALSDSTAHISSENALNAFLDLPEE